MRNKNTYILLAAIALLSFGLLPLRAADSNAKSQESSANFENPSWHFEQARLCEQEGDYQNALFHLQWASNIDPMYKELKAIAGYMFPLINRVKELAESSTEFKRENEELYGFINAYDALTLGPPQEARILFGTLVEKYPDQAIMLLYAGELDFNYQDYVPAFEKLKKVYELNPWFYRVCIEIGDAAYKNGQIPIAQSWWEKALDSTRIEWVKQQATKRIEALKIYGQYTNREENCE